MKKIGLNSSLISAQEDVNNNRKSLKREDSRLEIERGIEAFLVGTSGAGLIGMAYATFLNKKYEQEKARKQRRDQFMENLYGCDRLINEEEITLGD